MNFLITIGVEENDFKSDIVCSFIGDRVLYVRRREYLNHLTDT